MELGVLRHTKVSSSFTRNCVRVSWVYDGGGIQGFALWAYIKFVGWTLQNYTRKHGVRNYMVFGELFNILSCQVLC